MSAYIILNSTTASRCQFAHYLQRTDWLNVGQTGAFTDEMLGRVQSDDCKLVFLRLADPEDEVPGLFLDSLRRHPAVIITSPYPKHLFSHLKLTPFDFLTEPYSFERFTISMDKYVSVYA